MNDQPVLFSRAAASCRLTLNREDKCHAINEEMIESLDHYLNEIEKIKKQLEKQDEFIDNIQNWIEIVNKYKNIDTLNYEIIHMLISKIIIHEREVTNEGEINQKIEIEYAFIGSLDKGDIE